MSLVTRKTLLLTDRGNKNLIETTTIISTTIIINRLMTKDSQMGIITNQDTLEIKAPKFQRRKKKNCNNKYKEKKF